jgi:hypothetical protein
MYRWRPAGTFLVANRGWVPGFGFWVLECNQDTGDILGSEHGVAFLDSGSGRTGRCSPTGPTGPTKP